jgi:metal-sulfur cluster biosynthetic enzyme
MSVPAEPLRPESVVDSRTRMVLAILEEIVDPCSTATGVPAGLVSMGLVRSVQLPSPATEGTLRVTLTMTEPGCLMAAIFAENARERLTPLAGADGFHDVTGVDVVLDATQVWEPDDMAPEYRRRLAAARRRRLPLAPR